VYVPEGVDVEIGGDTVDVWRGPNGVRGSYRDLIGQVEGGRRELPA